MINKHYKYQVVELILQVAGLNIHSNALLGSFKEVEEA